MQRISKWLREIDSNYRPLGYEPNELPTAPPRDKLTKLLYNNSITFVNTFFINLIYYMICKKI